MAAAGGQPMVARMANVLPHDGGQEMSHLSYDLDLGHAIGRHIHSDASQMSSYTLGVRVSGGDVKSPSIQKSSLGHVNGESSHGQTSNGDRVLNKISPHVFPSRHLDSGQRAHSSQTTQPNEALSGSKLNEALDSRPPNDSAAEVLRLKQELQAANSKIALQEQELAQTRIMKHTLDQALGPPSEADFSPRDINEPTLTSQQRAAFMAFRQDHAPWASSNSPQADAADVASTDTYNRLRARLLQDDQQAPETNELGRPYDGSFANPTGMYHSPERQDASRYWATASIYPTGVPAQNHIAPPRTTPTPTNSGYGLYPRQHPEQPSTLPALNATPTQVITRGLYSQSPRIAAHGNQTFGTAFNDTNSKPATIARPPSSMAFPQYGSHPISSYQTAPGATTLCPTASEFTATGSNGSLWMSSSGPGMSAIPTYVSPSEPPNYRRLLDKNISCDWKYIVEKIICNNDQQSSIFLQQKLKVGTAEQKFEIIQAIIQQAYHLMVNRFGNFLVQRCFEHGTQDQVIAIANAIRGNTVRLSMDQFGCHVIQKAFDSVSEEFKITMVNELLRSVQETVVHRYSCHVWQKLFELRWSEEPPQIMTKVNESLKGIWHEVALGETGSLVVQNIFENCVEEEKRPAIEEVLDKIDVLAHGQFGNWCIQHICEHGAPHDKNRAIEHVIAHSVDYSMDQFASKIIEKCLKIGGTEFLDRYLGRVCTGRADRPRMPLIDIAGDQYGNYLIQWILTHAASHQHEIVASHIRKHMVSLRGSKFGSRVAMLCCNPSHATRPGPGTGVQIGRYGHFNEDRFGSAAPNTSRYHRGNQWNPNYPAYR
ncbi:Meiotic coiled-coil protein 2 [Penicillium diatomitis]|uniref:Meiotic coiled-coil protein 2 n=1 Tax=Penicillium diatomitis TaxID=2819901 RepID=A0A9W9XMF2_9EURO|nr:Meiotic coiled-coil protein 2 [Penicillium diatomitis]KAJ5495598.1 Meiotic coiled-coil protein 2 [Penicillium diatomitis]